MKQNQSRGLRKKTRIIMSGLFLLGFTLSVGASISNYTAAAAIGLSLAIAMFKYNQKEEVDEN